MTYASEIDLGGIGQAPKTTDPETFADFTDVYNAIHILAQWVSMLYEHQLAKSGNDPDAPNYETMPPDNVIWETAAMNIKEGMFVSRPEPFIYPLIAGGPQRNGAFAGWVSSPRDRWPPIQSLSTTSYAHFGIAGSDAKAGEKVKILMGPGFVHFPGAKVRDRVYVSITKWSGRGNSMRPSGGGEIYLVPPTGGPYDLSNLIKLGVIMNNDELFLPPPYSPEFPPVLANTVNAVGALVEASRPRPEDSYGGP